MLCWLSCLLAVLTVWLAGGERRSLDRAQPQHRPAYDLQLRRPDPRPRDPHGHLQEGRQSAAIQLGQYADRPDLGRTAVPDPAATSSTVLDTTFPHDKPQMLYWNVQSEIDGEATIEITYFTSGITWSADYSASPTRTRRRWASKASCGSTTTPARSTRTPRFGWWSGTINLVEKIAELARIPVAEVAELEERANWAIFSTRLILPDHQPHLGVFVLLARVVCRPARSLRGSSASPPDRRCRRNRPTN